MADKDTMTMEQVKKTINLFQKQGRRLLLSSGVDEDIIVMWGTGQLNLETLLLVQILRELKKRGTND